MKGTRDGLILLLNLAACAVGVVFVVAVTDIAYDRRIRAEYEEQITSATETLASVRAERAAALSEAAKLKAIRPAATVCAEPEPVAVVECPKPKLIKSAPVKVACPKVPDVPAICALFGVK